MSGNQLALSFFGTMSILMLVGITAASVPSEETGNRTLRADGKERFGTPLVRAKEPEIRRETFVLGDSLYSGHGESEPGRHPVVLWKHNFGAPVVMSSPAVTEELVIVGTDDGTIFGLDRTSTFDDWPMAGGSPTRTRVVEENRIQWKHRTEGRVRGSPSVHRDTVYVGSYDNHLHALTVRDGTLRWNYDTGYDVLGSPAISGGIVYFGNRRNPKLGHKSFFHALNARTGEELWRLETDRSWASINSEPAVEDGVVFFATTHPDNSVHAVDGRTGERVWSFRTGDRVRSSPAAVGEAVFFGSRDEHLYSVNAKTGEENWRFRAGAEVMSAPAVVNGTVYFAALDGVVYALDAIGGDIRWRRQTAGGIMESSPAVHDGILYIGDLNGHLYALDTESGDEQWRFHTQDKIRTTPAVRDNQVHVVTVSGELFVLQAATQGNGRDVCGCSEMVPFSVR